MEVECGRERQALARAYAPYIVPVVLVVVVGIQAATIVVQVVLVVAIVRSRRPPVPVVSIVERAIVVVPTGNWRKSGAYGYRMGRSREVGDESSRENWPMARGGRKGVAG